MYHIIKIVGLYASGSPRLLTLSKGGRNTEYGVFGRFTLKMKRKHILGVLCVVLASACYGITPILSNAALNGGLPASFVARLCAVQHGYCKPAFAFQLPYREKAP